MIFVQWYHYSEGNHLIVAPSWKSAEDAFWRAFEEHNDFLYLSNDENRVGYREVQMVAVWEGELVSLGNDCMNYFAKSEYEAKYENYLTDLMHDINLFIGATPSVYEYVVKCDTGECEDCNYYGFRFKPEYNPRLFWESKNPAPKMLPHSDTPFPIWVAMKNFGHHSEGLTVQLFHTLAGLTSYYVKFKEDVALVFKGRQLSIPSYVKDRIDALRSEHNRLRKEEEDKINQNRQKREIKINEELLAKLEDIRLFNTKHNKG